MGRKPSKNLNLPPRMRARVQRSGKIFYYYDTGARPRKEIPLGDDYPLAVRKWSELEVTAKVSMAEILTFRHVAKRYVEEVIPKKASRTQADNLKELANLYKFFDSPPAPLESIEPIHIRQYLDWRKGAPVRANREKALFSHIWNMARNWGYTSMANPCSGINGFTETGRSVYVESDVLQAVYSVSSQPVRDALDLAYLTGQRPADVLKTQETDLRDGTLSITQGKTGKKLRITVEDDLKALIDRILEGKRAHPVRALALICNEKGRPFLYSALDGRFERARIRAAKLYPALAEQIMEFQFRDLRAKAGTDKADSAGDVRMAQLQLGHSSVKTTEIYIRKRRGQTVKPTR